MSEPLLHINDDGSSIDTSDQGIELSSLATKPAVPAMAPDWTEAAPKMAAYTASSHGRVELPAFLDFETNRAAASQAAAAVLADATEVSLLDANQDDVNNSSETFAKTTRLLIAQNMASLTAPPPAISDEDDDKNRKYGTIDGVFIRVVVSIFGVMMFLRMGWMVANAGFFLSVAIIFMSCYITVTTTFSITALCTNGKVLGGGPYYIVSRSVGIEFGTTIGILISFAMMIAIALNTVGFAEEVVKLYSPPITGAREWDTVLVALAANGLIFAVALGGVGWVNNINFALFMCIMGGFTAFLIGTCYRPYNFFEGYTGYSSETLNGNLVPNWSDDVDFFVVIGVFFPSVTGILGGVALSGELKDPGRNISMGTLSAIVFTGIVYIMILLLNAATGTAVALKDFKTRSFMVDVAFWPPLVYAGIFSATLSTALGLLISAPRVFAATLKDGLFPKLEFFAALTKSGDPQRGYILSILVASAVIVASGGQLNLIAPAVTVMYTAIYGIINYACFVASIGRSPGWRPQFKLYNKWHALSGVFGCVLFMFLTNWYAAIGVSVFAFLIYKYAEFRKSSLNLGDAHESFAYVSTMRSLWSLESTTRLHIKNYRPSFLVLANLCQDPSSMLKMAASFYKARGVIVQGTVVPGTFTAAKLHEVRQLPTSSTVTNRSKAFHNNILASTAREGMLSLMQNSGLGKVRTNINVVEFLEEWRQISPLLLADWFEIVKDSMRLEMGTMVIRGSSRIMSDFDATKRFNGNVDVFWLADEGGLNLLLPYLLMRNFQWHDIKLRVWIPEGENAGNTRAELMRILRAFRINAQADVLRRGILPSPSSSTASSAANSSSNLMAMGSSFSAPKPASTHTHFTPETEVAHYFLSYAPHMEAIARDSTMVFTTLPLPFPETTVSEYLQWLEELASHGRPTVFIRGSHHNVMTPFL
ncbi:hypothetical protein CAOG_04602 [Capsaspora owczarzaki ATCC 30864]|uniref:Uncharacterized protein n=1 Tax=Capsaspora owczarzaki (strain ATCC 30864) TaxID=595528 RepID=A0A0D2WRJ7_CAPO3|nr:hypothetical protein CAOG_04602 [Capsaspora owczarzaki ATCC 30864]KJE93883.1 hypothetical protein CAOG_004602 [Capsaspora owczarzaki ATCC 30864]|eukprot:XP_004347349.1 hypothetical protein CAOG_04602 [Capsaspora owczarzaki ATCC 30864]